MERHIGRTTSSEGRHMLADAGKAWVTSKTSLARPEVSHLLLRAMTPLRAPIPGFATHGLRAWANKFRSSELAHR